MFLLFWLLWFEVTVMPKAPEPQNVRPGGEFKAYLGQWFSNCVRMSRREEGYNSRVGGWRGTTELGELRAPPPHCDVCKCIITEIPKSDFILRKASGCFLCSVFCVVVFKSWSIILSRSLSEEQRMVCTTLDLRTWPQPSFPEDQRMLEDLRTSLTSGCDLSPHFQAALAVEEVTSGGWRSSLPQLQGADPFPGR